MAITDENGQPVDVAALNQEFARSQLDLPTEATAPSPPRRTRTAPAATKTPSRSSKAQDKKEPSKAVSAAPVATPKLHDKRKQSGADIMHAAAVASSVLHVTTGDEAWQKDAALYVEVAETFGESCAALAEKSPAFARYLDNEGTSTVGAYLGFGLITSQIGLAVLDNHNARGKIPGWIKTGVMYVKLGTRKILKGKKK